MRASKYSPEFRERAVRLAREGDLGDPGHDGRVGESGDDRQEHEDRDRWAELGGDEGAHRADRPMPGGGR